MKLRGSHGTTMENILLQVVEIKVCGSGKEKTQKASTIKNSNMIALQFWPVTPKMSNLWSGILNQASTFSAQVTTTPSAFGRLIKPVTIGLKNIRFKVTISRLSGVSTSTPPVTLLLHAVTTFPYASFVSLISALKMEESCQTTRRLEVFRMPTNALSTR